MEANKKDLNENYETAENQLARKDDEFVLRVTVIDGLSRRPRLPVPKLASNGSTDTLYDQIKGKTL